MGKPQKMDQQTVSEVAAIVTDEQLSSEAFRNIIEQCIQKGLEKKLDKINERLDLLDSNVLEYVQFNGMKSGLQNVTCGAPQGSFLGPKLFLLYINDICNVSNMLDFILYADDTNVFYEHENIDVMCKIVSVEIDKLSTWFALNKLALNISKTNFMISNHKSIEHSISIDGMNLQ